MQFDPDNKIVKLCAAGMEKEGEGKAEEASILFMQAWDEAEDDFEKFTAAHYVARHQSTVEDKLKWDEAALGFALKLDDEQAKSAYPSLYLNIAKCYEDLKDTDNALKHYRLALSHADALPQEGYGNMIRSGILSGIERIENG